MEYASKATGNTALGLSIGALGAELLTGGLTGLLSNGSSASSDYISRETASLMMENAILKADLNTETKIVDAVTALNDKINNVVTEQTAINAAQAVTNCGFNSAIAVAQTNINSLLSMTKLGIPSGNIITATTTTT